MTDSFTPRMFRTISTDDADDLERQLPAGASAGGRKLKSASPAAAIETVIVST